MTRIFFEAKYLRKHLMEIISLLDQYNQQRKIMSTASEKILWSEDSYPKSIDLSKLMDIMIVLNLSYYYRDDFYIEIDDDDVAVQFKLSLP